MSKVSSAILGQSWGAPATRLWICGQLEEQEPSCPQAPQPRRRRVYGSGFWLRIAHQKATPFSVTERPEYGRAYAYWATYTTSLGAILHDGGHCFGLQHPAQPGPGEIMWRSVDFLNRLAVTYENGYGPVDPTVDNMPRWTDQDVTILQSNPWFTAASQGNGHGGPQLLPGVMNTLASSIVVAAEAAHPLVAHPAVRIAVTRPSTTWTAQVESGGSLAVQLGRAQGNAADSLPLTIDTTGYAIGTFTASVRVTAADATMQGSPIDLPVQPLVVDHLWLTHQPVVTRWPTDDGSVSTSDG